MSEWRECTMAEALEWAASRAIQSSHASCVEFTDGSAIRCESQWSGPYSEVTPDIDVEPPSWEIREKPPKPDRGATSPPSSGITVTIKVCGED